MATDPQNRPGIQQQRVRRADGGDPVHRHDASVFASGNGLVIGLHSFEVRMHSIEPGQEPEVEVHEDGVWIHFGGDDE